MAMTFEEMCAACPKDTCFSIDNIPKDAQEEIDSITNALRDLDILEQIECQRFFSLRFNNDGKCIGELNDMSYRGTTSPTLLSFVRGGYYEFSELESPLNFQATLDVMSVL